MGAPLLARESDRRDPTNPYRTMRNTTTKWGGSVQTLALRTKLGTLRISATPSGIRSISIGGRAAIARADKMSPVSTAAAGERAAFPAGNASAGSLGRLLRKAARLVEQYLSGRAVRFDIPLDLSGLSAFQIAVYEACREIPRGQTRSYSWIASQIGRPKACPARAARAVGQALARNPLLIVVPCHRVVRADGSLGGFSAGNREQATGLGRRSHWRRRQRAIRRLADNRAGAKAGGRLKRALLQLEGTRQGGGPPWRGLFTATS